MLWNCWWIFSNPTIVENSGNEATKQRHCFTSKATSCRRHMAQHFLIFNDNLQWINIRSSQLLKAINPTTESQTIPAPNVPTLYLDSAPWNVCDNIMDISILTFAGKSLWFPGFIMKFLVSCNHSHIHNQVIVTWNFEAKWIISSFPTSLWFVHLLFKTIMFSPHRSVVFLSVDSFRCFSVHLIFMLMKIPIGGRYRFSHPHGFRLCQERYQWLC